jgi:hypothetical protein
MGAKQLTICDESAFVKFELEEVMPAHTQGWMDVSCSVEVFSEGFSGRIDGVWFARTEIERFLTHLQKFEKTRRGRVELINMSSPSSHNPLKFEMRAIDDTGHIEVTAELLKEKYTSIIARPNSASVSFEIDAGMLPTILLDFRKLFAVRESLEA